MRKILLFPVLLIVALACTIPGLPSSTSSGETLIGLETAIVQTSVAAQTQTVVAQPPTLTATVTREPTSTLIAQPPTQTPFSLFSATVPVETLNPEFAVTEGVAGLGSGPGSEDIPYTGEPWTCVLRGVNPPRGAAVEAGKEFYVTWTVLNTGTKNWTVNTIDFIYVNGYRHEGKPIQDLWKNVPSGRTIDLRVLFKAPKAPGEYRATWTLKVGNRVFCGMRTIFEVRE